MINKTSQVIQNTKNMEHNFIVKNLNTRNKYMDFCRNSKNEHTNFICSKTQTFLLNKILSEITLSVSDSLVYDDTDTSLSRAKRIYSRKKEILNIISVLFDNGGFMVRYFKYINKINSINSYTVTKGSVINFIKRIREAYNNAYKDSVDLEIYIKPKEDFVDLMIKLKIYNEDNKMRVIN